MSLRSSHLAAAVAALALLPAAAAAAPDREGSASLGGEPFTWSSDAKTGAVYTSNVAERVPACSPVFSCDATLIRTTDYGNVTFAVAGKGLGGQATLSDVDLHVYVSNANGDVGDVVGEDTSADADESVLAEDLPAGYYLVYVDWYLGAGSIDGTVTVEAPTTPTDTPPEFVPAPESGAAGGADTEPSREFAFSAASHEEQKWSGGPGAGVSDAVEAAGCHTVNCDYTLIKVDDPGFLTVTIAPGQPSMVDADIHLLASDAEGTEGEEVGSATAFSPNETLAADVAPGYYLMRVQYTGAGTYDGTASWAPPEPEVP